MKRKNKGKPLVLSGFINQFPLSAAAVSVVTESGCRFYGEGLSNRSWIDYMHEDINESLVRHIIAASTGDAYDLDSGLLHAAHVAWNALAALEVMLANGACIKKENINKN